MTKEKMNIKIAKMLGFKVHKVPLIDADTKKQRGVDYCWIYPEKFENLQSSSPAHDIPDFLEMIDEYISMAKKFKYGIVRDHTAIAVVKRDNEKRN